MFWNTGQMIIDSFQEIMDAHVKTYHQDQVSRGMAKAYPCPEVEEPKEPHRDVLLAKIPPCHLHPFDAMNYLPLFPDMKENGSVVIDGIEYPKNSQVARMIRMARNERIKKDATS